MLFRTQRLASLHLEVSRISQSEAALSNTYSAVKIIAWVLWHLPEPVSLCPGVLCNLGF